MMDKRCLYDLSHFSFLTGRIGKLQTLSVVPVVAGDSFEMMLEGVFRLSPLRRQLVMDCRVDLMAFYVPHRHIYGDIWIDFIKQGVDETVNLPTDSFTQSDFGCFGFNLDVEKHSTFNTIPRWISRGYMRIWNRYFRHPVQSELADDALITVVNDGAPNIADRKYGLSCCRIKRPWNTGMPVSDTDDREVSISGNKFDILDLRRVQARYKTEQIRDWFGQRYNDLLGSTWNSTVNIDADERPELLMRVTKHLSGYDVDGTDDASLGSYSGKAASMIRFGFPRKYFVEHGAVWIMALLRFPPVHYSEIHPLCRASNPSYKEIAGDPEVFMSEPPEHFDRSRWWSHLTSGGTLDSRTPSVNTADRGSVEQVIPFGQHYRYHPSRVHGDFESVQGFPFVSNQGFDSNVPGVPGIYVSDTEYNSVFQTQQLAQWQAQCRINLAAYRYIPGPLTSIFAGTR